MTDDQYQSAMGKTTPWPRPGDEGRLYLADYKALTQLRARHLPRFQQKYVEALLALFAVPAAGRPAGGSVRWPSSLPDAGRGSPIFTPSDGVAWELAKLHAQVADGNYHELISTSATPTCHRAVRRRHAAPARPRAPAERAPPAALRGHPGHQRRRRGPPDRPGGPVDRLLAGTIASSPQLAVDSVLGYGFNGSSSRGARAPRRDRVRSPAELPLPRRRPAALGTRSARGCRLPAVSTAPTPTCAADSELQAWLAELVLAQPERGLNDSAQGGAIRTLRTWSTW